MRRHALLGGLLAAMAVGAAATTTAQPQRPQATVTPQVITPAVAAGGEARLELHVKLPSNMHVQSNTPSDPLFIATALTIDLPPGLTLDGISYPKAQELRQEGLKEPLAVFGSDFTIAARVKVSRTAAAGALTLPGRLRYQACDEKTCYPPARAETKWELTVEQAKK